MGYIHPTELARIQAQIATKEAQLTAANDALTAALEAGDVQSYKFDSGEGSQSASRRGLKELTDMVTRLEQELNRLYNRVNGTGLVTMNLRRR